MSVIDAHDNGEKVASPDSIIFAINSKNPSWDITVNEDVFFNEAIGFAAEVIHGIVRRYESKKKAEKNFKKAIIIADKIVIMEKFIPWKEYAVKNPELLLGIYPTKAGEWSVSNIPVAEGSFEGRIYFPEGWCNDDHKEVINAKMNIEDTIFCDKGRFVAIFKSRQSAIRVAEYLIKNN